MNFDPKQPAKIGIPLLITALFCITTPERAQAQSSVTLYGVLDTFVTNFHPAGVGSVTRLDSSGLYASRWGMKGTEDLGGGNRATFALESGFNLNDGSAADSNRFFNRQAWVGLGNVKYGEVRLGRQNTPQFLMSGRIDGFTAASQASGWNNMFGAPTRVDNAVGYLSPVIDGFKFYGLYARGAVAGGAILPQDAGNTSFHMSLEYEAGPLYLGTNYEEVRNETSGFRVNRAVGGGSYQFAKRWQFFASIADEKASNSSLHTDLMATSLSFAFTPVAKLVVGYAYSRDHVSGAGHGNASEVGAMYTYALSKRTTLYGAASRLDQQGQRNSYVLGGAAVVEASAHITAVPGGTINGLQFGIVHFF